MTRYKELQTSYEEYSFRLREVNTQEGIASLQAWYQSPKVVRAIENMTTNEIAAYVFPEVGEYAKRYFYTSLTRIHR